MQCVRVESEGAESGLGAVCRVLDPARVVLDSAGEWLDRAR